MEFQNIFIFLGGGTKKNHLTLISDKWSSDHVFQKMVEVCQRGILEVSFSGGRFVKNLNAFFAYSSARNLYFGAGFSFPGLVAPPYLPPNHQPNPRGTSRWSLRSLGSSGLGLVWNESRPLLLGNSYYRGWQFLNWATVRVRSNIMQRDTAQWPAPRRWSRLC